MYIPDLCKEKVEFNQDERNLIFFLLLKTSSNLRDELKKEDNIHKKTDLKIIESILEKIK